MEPFPSSPEDPTSNGKHYKTRSRDLSFSELDPVLREQLKPNAHPYAIRTTSTALLSRSNSQSQRETRHSYVPSSPQWERGHRKGSSSFGGITAATPGSPRPLPVPPNTTSPTRQPRRAESAAPELVYQFPSNESSWIRHNSTSSASSSSMDLADLPPNPKIWTPSQLSAYLTTALRVRSGVKGDGEQEQEDLKLPVRVAQDIAAFVREKKINGRVFLRWEEGDLEGYGINKLWRTALLTSSRNLRQNVLRGRIWGFEDESLPTSPSGLRSPNPDTGSPNVPSLTPIPSVMYTPSAIRPNSNANLGAFEMLANDIIESPTSTRPTLGHGGVDGLPLSSGLGMGAPFVASVTTGSVQSGETTTEQESVPVFPSNANRYIIPKDGVAVKVAGDNIHDMERDEGQASIYTFNTAGGESPTRSPRGQAALSKEDEDEDSTPNKRSARVSPPSTTPPSNTNTMNKRPLPNPHSYISGTNARNAGSVRTRGVPMLSAEMVEMMKKEGLGLEGVDLNELGGLDLDQLGELGIGLGFGDEGVGAGSGSVNGIRGGTKSAGASLRLRPKRKSASGQGAPSTMPIGSQSLRIRTRTAPSMTTKIHDDDDDDNGAMSVPMLPSNHPNFPNGLPVYSSASEGEPALELGLGGSIRKRKELQEQEGTMGRAGGRKSLSRVMARELVSKSKKMMMEQDNNPLPPLPHSPSSSSRIRVKGMVQTFERSTSFDEGQVGDDTQDQGDAKGEDKEGRRSRILEDMKALREMARVRRERSGSTSSLSSTHSDSTHSESDSGSSVGSGARDNDNEDVFLSSPVEDKVGEGLGTMRPLPVPPAAVDLGYDTATAKMVKSLPSPPPPSQQQTQIISPTQLLPPTPPLSVGAEEPTIEELLAEQDAAAAAAGLAASGVHGQGHGQGQGHAYAYAYGTGPNEGTDTMKYVGSSVSTSAVGGDGDIGRGSVRGKKNRVGSRVKASDVANGTGSLKGSSTARKGVGVYAWEAEVEDGEERDNSYELAAGESPSGKPKTNKGRVTVKRVPTQALQDAPSPGKVRPLPVPPETTDDNEESVASLAKSIKQTKTLLAAFEERLGEVERKVEVMEEREEARQKEQEGENKKGKSKSFMQRLVYRFFGISLGSKSTAVPSEERDSNASSASDKLPPSSSSSSSSTPESRIQRALAGRIPQRYHARLAAVLDPHTLMAIAPYVLFMSIGVCVVVWRLMMRRGGIAVTARR